MKLRLLHIFVLILSLTAQVIAQNVINDGLSAKSVVYASSHHKVFNNPSLLYNIKQKHICIYNGNRYLLKELQNNGISFSTPFKQNNYLGLGFCNNGNKYFGNYYLTASLAKRVEKNLSLALSFNYNVLKQGEKYNAIKHYDANFSLNYKVKSIIVGMSIENIATFFLDNAYLYPCMRIGMGYNANEYLLCFIEFDKLGHDDFSIVGGLSCIFQDKLCVSIGTAGTHNILALGASVNHNKYSFEIDCTYHIVLGLSPSLCITRFF